MENKQKGRENGEKQRKVLAIVALSLCVVLAFLAGFFSRYVFESRELNKTHDLVQIIERFGHVLDENGNPRELTETDYARALIDGVLDEYSTYYTKEEYEKRKSEKNGNRTGFGFSVYNSEKYLKECMC